MIGFPRGRMAVWRILGALSVVLVVAACSSAIRKHGYVPPPEDLAQVQVGVSTRDSVIETIGAPSSSGILNKGGFYYVATYTRKYGARAQRIVSRDLVAISFDSRDVVSGVQRFDLSDGKAVVLERRITDSGADNQTFLRQLVGNLTNFNPALATQ